MWLVLGIFAIGTTFLNLFNYKLGRDYKLFMAMALSFTALTTVAILRDMSSIVIREDWTALMDTMPTLSCALVILTMISIALNITPLLLENRKS